MNVIKLDAYRSKRLIFSGKLKRYAIDIVDGEKMLVIDLVNENIRFIRPLPNRHIHEINRILANSMIAKIPICIDAEYVDEHVYHIQDIGHYVQDN